MAAGAAPILCSLLGEQLEAMKRYENGPDPGFCSAAALTDIVEIGDNACRRKGIDLILSIYLLLHPFFLGVNGVFFDLLCFTPFYYASKKE